VEQVEMVLLHQLQEYQLLTQVEAVAVQMMQLVLLQEALVEEDKVQIVQPLPQVQLILEAAEVEVLQLLVHKMAALELL
jgi:hypothetical protein